MVCPVCRTRSARRACPALGQEICPVCCGTKRQVEIRCPDTCAYLSTARAHPPAAIRRQQEHDVATLAPAMAGLTEPRQQLLLFTLTLIDRFKGEGLDQAKDADVADAAHAMAATYETAARGIIYEHRPSSLPAQRMAAELRTMLDGLGRPRPSAFAADAAAVLGRIEQLVTAVGKASAGHPTALLELASRVARLFAADAGPAAGAGAGEVAAAPASPIILP